jgi:hypothetical protein
VEQRTRPRGARWPPYAAPAALLLYAAALYGGTALTQAGLFERDGYYHARLAQLVPERGLSRSFPWTQVSTWRDRYCDKEVLYHLAMAPFAQLGPEPILGARLFSVLLSVAVLAVLFLVLRAHGVPWPAYFTALTLASGGLFVARLGMIRSHVLSMGLLLVGLHLVLQRRWRAVLALSFVYAWSYTVPFVLVMTAAPVALGVWLGKGGLDWRSVLAAGLGALLGLAIHPYSPLTLETFLTILQIVRMGLAGADRSGVELGNEIYPYPLKVYFNIYPLVLLGAAALAVTVAWRWRELRAETKGLALGAAFWFGLTMVSARFTEYLVLLLAAAVAFAARDLTRPGTALTTWLSGAAWRRPGALVAALGLLVGFHAGALSFYRVYQGPYAPARFFDGAAAYMARNLAEGETVINLYWDDFPDLFYAAPRQRFLWGLDPVFTVRFDEEKALLLERSRRQQRPLDGAALAQAFGSRYLILRASRAAQFTELKRPPFREVYRDDAAVLVRIE